jgi:L-ascorbate metabolism protein UlaG (beta-lactamase superfamily)
MAMKLAALITGLTFCLFSAGCHYQNRPSATSGLPLHHAARGFQNLSPDYGSRGLGFLRWQLGLGPREEPALPPAEVPPYRAEVVSPDLNHINSPDPQRIQVTWIGHSTFLIQTAGLNLLTDPLFAERTSPVPFAGPRRQAPPGLLLGQLPQIHAVLVSHDHYDHLDAAAVKHLGNRPRYFVPLGLTPWFNRKGITNVVELDWWETADLGPLRLHCVPAQHASRRTPFDENLTLWSGWVVEGPAGNIMFTGDTGYAAHFREIGERLGPMRLSLIPIGGYRPRWFQGHIHANPPEAVRIHQDLRSQQSIGMHWGTFNYTDEPMAEPPLYLAKALKEAGIPPEKFVVFKIGETRIFP